MSPSPVQRVMEAIVPRAVDAIEPDELLERLDLDATLGRVDLDAVVQRIDLQQLLDRIDLNALLATVDIDALVQRIDLAAVLARVDIDAVVARVDIDAVVARVDIDALMKRVDIDALMSRVDVNGLVERVDIAALVASAGIDQIVRDATAGIATRSLDLVRRQILAIDVIVLGLVDRVLHRATHTAAPGPDDPIAAAATAPESSPEPEAGPPRATAATPSPTPRPIVGSPGGPVARLLAFMLDSLVVSASFGLLVTLTATLIGLFTGRSVNIVRNGGPLWLVAFAGWWFVYLWISVGLTGRTVGKAVIGLRVVDQHGGPLRPARAALRVLFLPVSLVLGLGLVPAVLGRHRRALHDYVAGSKVEIDWGGRDVMLPVALGERLDPMSNALATTGEQRPASTAR